jgi:hypothetical protein
MSQIHQLYPSQVLLETECASKLSNIYPEQMTIRVLRNGAQGVQLWNAALDQDGGPKIGNGCQGLVPPFQGQPCIAPVTVNTSTHTYSLTEDYWALAQFSRFIELGARRIDSSDPSSCPTSPSSGYDCGLEDVAFRNPDGSQVIVATAHDGKSHEAVISEGGRGFSYNVPDGAIVTFVLPAPKPTISRLRVPRRLRAHRPLRAAFVLAENATVRVALQRLLSRHRPHTVATKTLHGSQGRDVVRFRGRRATRCSTRQSYRLKLTATDAGGDTATKASRKIRCIGGGRLLG